ncbi:MAG: OmpH family outer membrane protein [Verrucomicrobia bacterium]|nr:OmpH family outer membrane protein [Verrucomicrobiota bacterium]
MNKLLASLLTLAAFAGLSAPVIAQPAPKIVIVDMAKILDEHYETVEQNAKLKTDEGRANEELEKLNKEGQDLVNALKEMEEKGKNPALANDAKEKLQAEMRVKIEDIQRKQQEVQSFRGNTQRSLQQRIQNFRKVLFDKISATVSEVAKKKSANLVLDKSGFTHIGLSPVIYSDGAFDITEEVQKEINKGRPAGTPAAPVSAPAPAAAKPAASDDGKVKFPGAK